MKLIRNIRLKIGRYLLAARLKRHGRKPFFSGMSKIRTAGLVWDASRPEDFQVLTRFHQQMKERNIEVRILGYFPGKVLPDKYTAIRYLTCLKDHDLDFFYRPNSAEAVAFIDERLDLMIDANFNKLFPLYYISSLSSAGLKAGPADTDPELSPFDLMIKIKSQEKIEDYLNQVIHYLEMMSKEPEKTSI